MFSFPRYLSSSSSSSSYRSSFLFSFSFLLPSSSALSHSFHTSLHQRAVPRPYPTRPTNTSRSSPPPEQVSSGGNQRRMVALDNSHPVYGTYHIYKTKAAVDISFTRPRVVAHSSNTGSTYYSVEKPGALRLEFAAAIPQPDSNDPNAAPTTIKLDSRAYAWRHKETFQLSVVEMGEILSFAAFPSATEAKWKHDPHMKTDSEGSVLKDLTIRRFPGQGKGYLFTFNVSKDSTKSTVMIPLTDGEFAVLTALIQNAIPKLLGMHRIIPLVGQEEESNRGEASEEIENRR